MYGNKCLAFLIADANTISNSVANKIVKGKKERKENDYSTRL